MKPNKFQDLKYRCVKINEDGSVCIISAHSNINSCLYDYNILKTMDGTFDIEHCVGYDEDGLGIWETYKGANQ